MALELIGVTRQVGADTHIHPTDLRLEPGSFNMLLGTTLAGKTTLMQLMAGLVPPTTGQIRFRGKDVTGMRVQKRNVSMVYQQFINYPNLTVYENIASPLRVAGEKHAELDRRVKEVADLLKLGPMLQRRPGQLSGGQQQRTALARALVKEADLVLLDEPLANLDFKLREELREELPKLFAERDVIVVYATTEPTEALLFGGNTATLFEGRVTQFGPTGEIYRRPKDLVSALVFSDPPINTARVVKADGTLSVSGSSRWPMPAPFAVLPDGEYTLGIRPHHIAPSAQSATAVPVEGRVLVTELSGSESIVHFNMEGGTWVSQSHGIHPYEVGAAARFYADMSHAMIFSPETGALIAAPGAGS
jgi:glycerol transport system ATP-binding protein